MHLLIIHGTPLTLCSVPLSAQGWSPSCCSAPGEVSLACASSDLCNPNLVIAFIFAAFTAMLVYVLSACQPLPRGQQDFAVRFPVRMVDQVRIQTLPAVWIGFHCELDSHEATALCYACAFRGVPWAGPCVNCLALYSSELNLAGIGCRVTPLAGLCPACAGCCFFCVINCQGGQTL